jgi:oligoribonuclease
MAEHLKLVWIDMEMTGLNPDTDSVLEIACIITGPDLKPLAQTECVIHAPADAVNRMSDFVRDMHTRNGLLARCAKSTTTVEQAEKQVLQLVAKHCEKGQGVLAGNSIHQDRRFLIRHMPTLESVLHYRQVDVSSFKVMVQAWYPTLPKFEKPGKAHTALADLNESIAELAYYREKVLKAG